MSESNIWEKLTAVSSCALAVIALTALIFTYLQITESRHESQIQHLAEVVHDFDSGSVRNSLSALATKRIDQKKQALSPLDPTNPPGEIYEVANFFEYVGLLTKRGYLDQNDVWDSFGYYLCAFYADSRPLIEVEQKGDPENYADMSWLEETLRQIDEKSHSGRGSHCTQKDIYDFYDGEIETPSGVLPPHHNKASR